MPSRPTLAQIFATRVAQIRRWRNLSQRVLGEQLGLSKAQGSSRINRYERGGSFGTAESLEALAKALNVPAACFLAPSTHMVEALLFLSRYDEETQRKLVADLVRQTKPSWPESRVLLRASRKLKESERKPPASRPSRK